jgi:hypothetical protein
MKRTRWVLGVAFMASVFSLAGCGQGTYRIPAVEPVVKPKPGGDDLFNDIAGGDDSKPASTESKPSAAPPPAEKEPEAKPDATKPEPPKAEPKSDKAEGGKPDKAPAKPGAKPADAKPAGGKPNGKK